MIRYIMAGAEHSAMLTSLRLEVLRQVNRLPDTHVFPHETVCAIDAYWAAGDHATVIALDGDEPIACATMCYLRMMPTFSHPTGLRGHLMNVYTRAAYRCQGIARTMVTCLLDDARARGATEVSLDATDMGRPLYTALGFTPSEEAMVLAL